MSDAGRSDLEAIADERLHAHVDRVIARTAIPRSERDDVAEELYGHVWQRWRQAVDAGADPLAAADSAIADFGTPDELAPEMTRAFHSRLYATTIGVLLPLATARDSRPNGYGRARALLFLSGLFQIIGGAIFLIGQTPGRAAASAVVVAFAFAITVLAYRALDRAQRWALMYVRLFTVALLVYAIAQVPLAHTLNLLGVVALVVLPPVFGPEFRRWVGDSRPVGPAVAILIVAAMAAQFLFPFGVAAMPDPTVVTASDVSMTVHVDCAGDQWTPYGNVTAKLRWARTDLMPGGLPFQPVPTDEMGLSVAPIMDVPLDSFPSDPGTAYPIRAVYGASSDSAVDATTGANVLSLEQRFASSVQPFFTTTGQASIGVEPSAWKPGHDYVVAWHFAPNPPASTGLEDAAAPHPDWQPVFRVRFDHQGRIGLEAIAKCGETVIAHPAVRFTASPYPGMLP